VPFVLRPVVDNGGTSSFDNSFWLVSDCYLHGITDGEAMADDDDGDESNKPDRRQHQCPISLPYQSLSSSSGYTRFPSVVISHADRQTDRQTEKQNKQTSNPIQ
jgi:hypothetical protein